MAKSFQLNSYFHKDSKCCQALLFVFRSLPLFWRSKVSPPPSTSVPLSRLIPSILSCRSPFIFSLLAPLAFYKQHFSGAFSNWKCLLLFLFFSLFGHTAETFSGPQRHPLCSASFATLLLFKSFLTWLMFCVSYLNFSAHFSYFINLGHLKYYLYNKL